MTFQEANLSEALPWLPRWDREQGRSQGASRGQEIRHQSWVASEVHKDPVRPDEDQPRFFKNKIISLLHQGHGVSDFQQDIWPNFSGYSTGWDGEMWELKLWQVVLPKGYWLMDWCQSQILLTNILINKLGSLKSRRHSHRLSPGTYLCQSHPHIPMTCSQAMLPFVSSPWLKWFPSLEHSSFSNTMSFTSPLRGHLTRKPLLTIAHHDQTKCSPLGISVTPMCDHTCHATLLITIKPHLVGDC